MTGKIRDSNTEFESAISEAAKSNQKYILRLYITGMTSKSTQAIQNVKKICEEHLKGRYELEVVDISQQPVLARGEQIIATPTLIKRLPEPLRRFIGNMSDTDKILLGLDVISKGEPKSKRKPEKRDKGKIG